MVSSKNSSHPPLILISCGGTGGHLLPGLAVGEQIAKDKTLSVLFLVNDKKVLSFFTRKWKSDHHVLPEVKYAELTSLRFWRPLWHLLKSLFFLIRLFATHRVIGALSAGGGAGTLPILISRVFGIPSALLEQNVIMGKANRVLLPFVKAAYSSLPCSNVRNDKKMKCLGNPLRESLLNTGLTRSQAGEKLGLAPDVFTLLILGGSQGARSLNEWALRTMEEVKMQKKDNLQVIHLTGHTLLSECRALYQKMGLKAHCEAFCEDMGAVYTLSDFCISRAGGGGLSELTLFHIPSVYVPFPSAAEDHQKANATLAEQWGVGWMLEEKELGTDSGKQKLLAWIEDAEAQARLRENQKKHATPNAARDIANDFLNEILKHK